MTDSQRAELCIRPMELEDLPLVQEIDQLSFPTPWSAQSYRYELLKNPVSQLFVAEKVRGKQREVVGYVGLWEFQDEGHISTLAVHPDHRREGIGRSLLEVAFQALAKRGIDKVSLEVRESNEAAQHLYREYGFKSVGRRRGYYRSTQEDALIMLLEGISQQLEMGGAR
ncbi:MAG: ribosomal protein S18-alanine N-acetyltransferase [Anaerolineae bacterium]|nr:ribosomal protein S18-alanine N-acetyltransferase [Anaerolineae bacterium]